MEIKTKFSINDEVYWADNGKILNVKIVEVRVRVSSMRLNGGERKLTDIYIEYRISYGENTWLSENCLFKDLKDMPITQAR